MSLITTGAIVASLCGAQVAGKPPNNMNYANSLSLRYTSNRTNLISSRNGYLDYQYKVYSATFTEKSKLVCLNTNFCFVPGVVVKQNHPELNSNYEDAKLQGGYIHLKVRTWENEVDPVLTVRSGSINYIESYPNKSTKLETSVSSNFGVDFEMDFTTNGDLEEDGFKIEYEAGVNLKITCSKSVTTIGDDPRVSFQHHVNDKEEAQWSFTVDNLSKAGSQSFNFDSFHFFEIDNYCMNFEHQYLFEVILDVMMDTKYKIFEADPEYCHTIFTGEA